MFIPRFGEEQEDKLIFNQLFSSNGDDLNVHKNKFCMNE